MPAACLGTSASCCIVFVHASLEANSANNANNIKQQGFHAIERTALHGTKRRLSIDETGEAQIVPTAPAKRGATYEYSYPLANRRMVVKMDAEQDVPLKYTLRDNMGSME